MNEVLLLFFICIGINIFLLWLVTDLKFKLDSHKSAIDKLISEKLREENQKKEILKDRPIGYTYPCQSEIDSYYR